MAAPSVGRRSYAGQREAAALYSQSRRWLFGRIKGLLHDGFFSFAVVRQVILVMMISLSLKISGCFYTQAFLLHQPCQGYAVIHLLLFHAPLAEMLL